MKPVLVYDGDCAFCTRWVARWHRRTGERVTYVPFQEHGVLPRLGIPLAHARRSIQLVEPDGTRSEGAEAVFRVLSYAPGPHLAARVGRLPIVRWFAERVYRVIARHRTLASRIDRMLFSRRSTPPRYTPPLPRE